ncbi:MAG: copper chaperone PCu(A)C [Halofilum sp. (in: g-proteobacteria)]|nr:copper chaperone PCu(A)C [Halofilum sp. (in: g-proteobacteria)]
MGVNMRVLLVLALVCIAGPAAADRSVRVDDARIGWVPGWVPHPGFLELTNTGDGPLQLTGARSNEFARIEFKAPDDGDLFVNEPMAMPVGLAPGDTLSFEPGGAYLLLFVQSSWLEPGARVTIELLFAERAPLPVEFTVRKLGS